MFKKKVLSIAIIALMLFSIIPFSALAEDNQYVYLSIEKYTLGQGAFVEPTRFVLAEGETVQSLIEKAVGAENLVIIDSQYGDYLGGIKDGDDSDAEIPEYILDEIVDEEVSGRAEEGVLSNLDYTSQSGWMFAVNNESAMVSMGEYELEAGDVVRLFFSVYGYGMDVGFGYDFDSGKSDASYITSPNRDELIIAIADAKEDEEIDSEVIEVAINVLANLEASETELAEAVDSLSKEEEPKEEPNTPPTGDCMLILMIGVFLVSGVFLVRTAIRVRR